MSYSRAMEKAISGVHFPTKQWQAREWPQPLALLRVMSHNDTCCMSHLPWETLGCSGHAVGMPLVLFQLSQCVPWFSSDLWNLSVELSFPIVLGTVATLLTSSWPFLRQMRSSFRDSTWASRSDLHRVSSPRIPRRPLMSFSTSWRRDSSLSYLQSKRKRRGAYLAKQWPKCWDTGVSDMWPPGSHIPQFSLHPKWWWL